MKRPLSIQYSLGTMDKEGTDTAILLGCAQRNVSILAECVLVLVITLRWEEREGFFRFVLVSLLALLQL